MNAKHTLTGAVAVTAAVAALLNHRLRINRKRNAQFDGKCLRDALETFEGEGGLVLPS